MNQRNLICEVSGIATGLVLINTARKLQLFVTEMESQDTGVRNTGNNRVPLFNSMSTIGATQKTGGEKESHLCLIY